MGAQSTTSGDKTDDEVRFAAASHRFRNQIQQMTSLVGMFGRRLPAGPGREAFEDVRARFEAITFVEPMEDGDACAVALPELARRVVGHLDPTRRHRVAISGAAVHIDLRSASSLAQLMAEMTIDLMRNGLGVGGERTGEISVDQDADGRIRLRAAQTGPVGATETHPADGGLGVALAESFARRLGASFTRSASGPLLIEADIPAEPQRR